MTRLRRGLSSPLLDGPERQLDVSCERHRNGRRGIIPNLAIASAPTSRDIYCEKGDVYLCTANVQLHPSFRAGGSGTVSVGTVRRAGRDRKSAVTATWSRARPRSLRRVAAPARVFCVSSASAFGHDVAARFARVRLRVWTRRACDAPRPVPRRSGVRRPPARTPCSRTPAAGLVFRAAGLEGGLIDEQLAEPFDPRDQLADQLAGAVGGGGL